ncbi:uncharacterized protein BHQ10_008043 [Talaromyces amestolkiae]|uniref:deoxyribose-phosphate aldolase n=1 Tax=Talaromyces amestolkiae TaxID=1196081 RepID=A0A364L8K6_TALAM|nr:uncharacterized protein BHQ10_008043 [Talaromyces amestolkiae]RAO72031.1 hypothetical protein BHQ10_008043 [Talaromyces amestolkiae]
MIDHSLLHPTMTDEDILSGLRIARENNVATACIKPYAIPLAKQELTGTDVKVCPVIGFPHGNSTTEIKVAEATAAAKTGGAEIDMVVNIGKVLGGDWEYVAHEIDAINQAVTAHGAILKVIFENDYLQSEHIIRLCEICTGLKVAFVKTSTGYGFVKQSDGSYNYLGATIKDLKLMRQHSGPEVQIKAAGGVRTLDDLLHVMSIGVTRIGATATVAILDEARKRGIGNEPVTVTFKPHVSHDAFLDLLILVDLMLRIGYWLTFGPRTYYLFHGSPNLAWPVCGCGLRIAQALNLHRKPSNSEPVTSPEAQRKIETRKRCWWAIYEIETFCSISYGYPHGIVDADCNVEFLDPLATSPGQSPASYNAVHQCPATLLSYKYLMSKLSVLLKDVLTDLYGIGSHQSRGGSKERSAPLDLEILLRKVHLLDDRIQKWNAEIPDNLRLTQSTPPVYSSAEEMDRDVGASGPRFESHVYHLQALALSLAYENARILVHRPLLTYRTTLGRWRETTILPNLSEKTSHLSLQACRDAAMNTSHLAESPIFSLAADTYAAAFISIHTFTAGVMLCVLASIEPLTPESLRCKLGLRRLMKMQARLRSRAQESPLTAQGLEILERLTRLVMEKELKDILSYRSDSNTQPVQALSEGQQPNFHVDMIEIEGAQRGVLPDFVEDTTISQALFDLDQVLFEHNLNIPLDSDTDFAGPSNGIAQEQAWIWSVESPMQS